MIQYSQDKEQHNKIKKVQKMYKRTIKESDDKHIIIYLENGYEQHIKIYNDGTREEWLEFTK